MARAPNSSSRARAYASSRKPGPSSRWTSAAAATTWCASASCMRRAAAAGRTLRCFAGSSETIPDEDAGSKPARQVPLGRQLQGIEAEGALDVVLYHRLVPDPVDHGVLR